jgi:hypothetical protein
MDDLNAPATKGDLQKFATKDDLQRFATREDLQQAKADLKDELVEVMRDVQTELLKAFYSFAKSTDAKLQDAEISDHLIRQRVSAVESRLTEIERRLNMPPAA